MKSIPRPLGVVMAAAYIGTIVAANWAVHQYGPVPVGFGLMAPAGVYFVGLALTLRDLTQRTLGRRWTLAAIVAGALLSTVVADPALAVASGVTFLVAESADMAVYTPLQERGLIPAVLASNAVGIVVDSLLFLWLADAVIPGPMYAFLPGQLVGKATMTLAALPVLWLTRRAFLPRHP